MDCKPNKSFQYISDIVIFVGIIILFITIGISNTQEGMYGQMIGYGFLTVGFIIKAATSSNLFGCIAPNLKMSYFLYSVLPFIIVALLGVLVIMILSNYYNRIVGGKVTEDFYMFSKMFIVLVCAQIGLYYYGANKKDNPNPGILSAAYGMAIYLLSLLNALVLISIYIVLAYYTTDG